MFEVIDAMPTGYKPKTAPRRRILTQAGTYYSGYVRCGCCGKESPVSDDPLAPFRWLGRHNCNAAA